MHNEQTQDNIITLQDAARENQMVEFVYIKPNKAISVRTILPERVEISAKGDPSIMCYDLGRRMVRRYRIDRIQGEVVVKGKRPEKGYDSEPFEVEEYS